MLFFIHCLWHSVHFTCLWYLIFLLVVILYTLSVTFRPFYLSVIFNIFISCYSLYIVCDIPSIFTCLWCFPFLSFVIFYTCLWYYFCIIPSIFVLYVIFYTFLLFDNFKINIKMKVYILTNVQFHMYLAVLFHLLFYFFFSLFIHCICCIN